jgi:carbon storage regulator
MLQLTRKPGQTIVIGDDIRIHVVELQGGAVRVGIEAPRSVPVYREEIWEAVKAENEAAARATGDVPRLPKPR